MEREITAYRRLQASSVLDPKPSCGIAIGCPKSVRTWSGELPGPSAEGPLSSKVFVAPVLNRHKDSELIAKFSEFGLRGIQWLQTSSGGRPKFCYILLESGNAVALLLERCRQSSSSRSQFQGLDVVPWYINDATYVAPCAPHEHPSVGDKRTIFVGGLHGMATAAGLAHAFTGLFGQVTHASLNADQYKYPTGCAQVTFASYLDYRQAVECRYVQLKTKKFTKTVQIEPFLMSSPCITCHKVGPLFCRESACFAYFCFECWQTWHSIPVLSNHKPICRRAKHL